MLMTTLDLLCLTILVYTTSTPLPRMHQKLTKHGKFCKQNNQLPTRSHDELEDNSVIEGKYDKP